MQQNQNYHRSTVLTTHPSPPPPQSKLNCDTSQNQKLIRHNNILILQNANASYQYIPLLTSLKLQCLQQQSQKTLCGSCTHQIFNLHYQIVQKYKCDRLELEETRFCVVAIHVNDVNVSHYIYEDKGKDKMGRSLMGSNETIEFENAFTHIKLDSQQTKNIPQVEIQHLEQQKAVKMPNAANKYQIYVTKARKSLNIHSNDDLIHEFAWQPQQIQYMMCKITAEYGEFQSIKQKRRTLVFGFNGSISQHFLEKYQKMERHFLFRQYDAIQKNISVNYYIVSTTTLDHMVSHKLFVLPKCDRIVDFVNCQPWIIIAAPDYLIFLHSLNALEQFKIEEKVKPVGINIFKHLKEQIKAIVLMKTKELFVQNLKRKKVVLEAIIGVPFIYPYCLSKYHDEGLLVGGINFNQKNIFSTQQVLSSKRKIFLIHNFFTPKLKPKLLKYDDDIFILSIQSQPHKSLPLSSIIHIPQQNIIIISWYKYIYLYNMLTKQKQKIIEVELHNIIYKCIQLPFRFNVFNIVVGIAEGDVIRVGFDYYGEKIGAGLGKYKVGDVGAFCLLEREGGCSMALSNGRSIYVFDYLREKVERVLFQFEEQCKQRVVNIGGDKNGVAFLLDLQYSIQLHYVQF